MSVTADNVIQENTGTVSPASTSCAVSLSSGTTAGNTVIVFLIMNAASTVTPPTGFSLDKSSSSGTALAYHKNDVAASETSWTFTSAASSIFSWYATEMSNVDPVDPLDAAAGPTNVAALGNGGTLSTTTTSLNAGLSTVEFAVFGAENTTNASWSGYTNSFEEVADVAPPGGGGSNIAVARKFQDGTTATFESTATFATTGTPNTSALIAVYRAADSPVAAPLALATGFEWGTHGGMGSSSANNPIGTTLAASGTWGTTYLVQAGSARVSSYGLRIAPSASTAYVPFGSLVGAGAMSVGFNTRVVSGSGVVVVAVLAASTSLQLVYDTSTSKYGLRWGSGGTPSYQSGTTATSTWVWVDIRARINSTVWHADWRIETDTDTYTDQTSPADLTGQTAASFTSTSNVTLGTSTPTQTMTADYDDLVISRYYGAYPLGPHKISLLTVDPAGTPSVSGTSTNFSVFTANGTLAAWNAANARDAVDDVPPTISASADGVVQTAVAASDYMEFPMATYTCAFDEIIAAVRFVAPMWGGTGTGTGQLGLRGHDGTTETTFDPGTTSYDADSLTAASSTYPIWRSAMWPSVNGWTQTELNNAVVRVGYSADATPDMGIHAAYLEVAIKKLTGTRQITLEDPLSAAADIYVHPYTSASVSYLITNNDASRSVNFNYSISGTPQTPVTVGPSSNQTVQVNADSYGDISDLSLEPI